MQSEDIFQELRLHANSRDANKKRNYTNLQSIESEIRKKQSTENEVISTKQYYSCILRHIQRNDKNVECNMYLLKLILPSLPLLERSKSYADGLSKITGYCQEHMGEIKPALLRSIVSCIRNYLQAVPMEESKWNDPIVKKSLLYLFSLCVHESGKIRHYLQDELYVLFEGHFAAKFTFSSTELLKYFSVLCQQFDEEDYKEISYFLALIARLALVLSPSVYPSLLELLLNIRHHECMYMDSNSLKPIEVILNGEYDVANESVEEVYQQIILTPAALSRGDIDILQYIRTLCSCVIRMIKNQNENVERSFVKITRVTLGYLKNDRVDLAVALTGQLQQFYSSIHYVFSEATEKECLSRYKELLTKNNKNVYLSIIRCLDSLVQLFGSNHTDAYKDILLLLVRLYNINDWVSTRSDLLQLYSHLFDSIGVEKFLSFVTITGSNHTPDEKTYFLFDVMKQRLIYQNTSLAFFFTEIYPIIQACMEQVSTVENETKKRLFLKYARDCWYLFIAFCIGAKDVPLALPTYKDILIKEMKEGDTYCSSLICEGIAVLVEGSLKVQSDEKGMVLETRETKETSNSMRDDKEYEEVDDEMDNHYMKLLSTEGVARLSIDEAEATLSCVSHMSEEVLEAMMNVYRSAHGSYEKDIPRASGIGLEGSSKAIVMCRCCIQSLLHAVAVESREKYLQSTMKSGMVDCKESQLSNDEYREVMIHCGLLSCFIPYMKEFAITPFFKQLQCIIYSAEGEQLRRYEFILLLLCKYHSQALIESCLETIWNLLNYALKTQPLVIRKYRLKCMLYLAQCMSSSSQEHIMKIITTTPTILLHIKDSSNNLRYIVFEVLIQFSRIMKDSSVVFPLGETEQKASLQEFFRILQGCISGKTSNLQSSALLCLSRLCYYYKNEESVGTIEREVLHYCYELLEGKNKEVIKSCLGYIHTFIKVERKEVIEEEISDILRTTLLWGKEYRYRFQLKVKAIIELLIRTCGLTQVKEAVPEESASVMNKLLNIKETKEEAQQEKEEEGAFDEEDDIIEIDEMGNIKGEESKKNEVDTDLMKEIAMRVSSVQEGKYTKDLDKDLELIMNGGVGDVDMEEEEEVKEAGVKEKEKEKEKKEKREKKEKKDKKEKRDKKDKKDKKEKR